MASQSVFINAPYDAKFEDLFLALVVGLRGYGLIPRATIDLPSYGHRIDRILELLNACDFSIHDLSRVALTEGDNPVPKFNMPFELGLAYHHSLKSSHQILIFARNHQQFEASLGDLKGIDIYEHHDDIKALFSCLAQAFVKEENKPTVPNMMAAFELAKAALPNILVNAGAKSLFHAQVFHEVVFVLGSIWKAVRPDSSSLNPIP